MANFSKEEIIQIKKLFKDELNLIVSEEEASRHATQLVDLLRVTYRESNDQIDQSPP